MGQKEERWVPSPEEVEAGAAAIRAANLERMRGMAKYANGATGMGTERPGRVARVRIHHGARVVNHDEWGGPS